jgi:glycosyltransferase involved in cell wall biosynthesis
MMAESHMTDDRAALDAGPAPASERVLMVAYHFPPLTGSSGIQRTLRFAQQLPLFGWEPIVLTASQRAYERTALDLERELPASLVVERAFALDAARHLAVGGRYLQATARPDRWASWRFDAVCRGLRLVRKYRPKVLWSTFPIATAHAIGAELQRRTGLPWIADFRDPMAQDGYPPDPETWRAFKHIEQLAVDSASWLVFTTPGAAREYRERYPQAAARIAVLENGYDEGSFVAVGADPQRNEPLNPGCVTLLHSGIVYREERDPSQLFAALGRLRASGLTAGRLRVRFRAAVQEMLLRELAAHHGVQDEVEILPAIGYRDALAEMLRADALLVMQAASCNAQIPAKIYEYLRAGRPILCLADPAGDTEAVCRDAGLTTMARLTSVDEIETLLRRMLSGPSLLPRPSEAAVAAASRLSRSRELARYLVEAAEALPVRVASA